MSYLALYRQWRPQLLGEIVGQEHITSTLGNAVTAGKVSHAYLFCGPRGTGKTSTAKVLARAVNCSRQQDGEPCNQCPNCLEIMAGSTMDVVEIDAASNRGIDEIRELKENIKFFPSRASRRVYIVDEVHMLTNEAFNALLKTLEEPPGHVVFVLATTEPHKVPLTILSRCQRFDFRPIPGELIARRLVQVADMSNFTVETPAIRAITRAAGGSLRDALSIMDQALLLSGGGAITGDIVHGILGTVRDDSLCEIIEALAKRDNAGVLVLVDQIASGGHDLRLLAGELTERLRGLLIAMLVPDGSVKDVEPWPTKTNPAALFNRDRLIRAIDLLVDAEQVMRRSAHPRVVLEVALARFMAGEGTSTGAELLARVERLERALGSGVHENDPGAAYGIGTDDKNGPGLVAVPPETPRANKQPAANINAQPPAQEGPVNNAPPEKPPEPGSSKTVADSPKDAAVDREVNRPEKAKPVSPGSEPANSFAVASEPGAHRVPVAETGVKGTGRYGIEQIRKWWPDILQELKRVNPAIYTYLSLVWPAGVKDHCLVLGVPAGDVFSMQMVTDEGNKELLVKTLRDFTREDWSVRCSYFDTAPPGWDGRQASLEPEDTISLFRGEEITLPEDGDKN